MVSTSNLCRNIQRQKDQLNQYSWQHALVIWKEQTKIHQYTQQINQRLVSHPCMHMTTQMRLGRSLDETLSLIMFVKLRSHFYCALKK